MHELSLVAELITACELRSGGRPVELVRVRHASAIPKSALRQAWRMLSEGSCMANATLEAEPFDVELRCRCGFVGALGHDDLIGAPVVVCPACGEISMRERTAELELLEVRLAPRAVGADGRGPRQGRRPWPSDT